MENNDIPEEKSSSAGDAKTEVGLEEATMPEETPPSPSQVDDNHEDPDKSALNKVYEEIDRIVTNDDAVPAESVVDEFLDVIEEKIAKLEKEDHDGQAFLESVTRVSKLYKSIVKDPKREDIGTASIINRIGSVQQRAMAYLEEEFRSLLEDSKTTVDGTSDNIINDQNSISDGGDDNNYNNNNSNETTRFPCYPRDVVLRINKIAKEMIFGGYESECCEVYMIARRNAMEEILQRLGFEKISIDDIQKTHWESLEREIAPAWIKTFR